jgi:amino acid transporter
MAEKIAASTENAGIVATTLMLISTWMDWLNDNHLAVISLCAIATFIVTGIASYFRIKMRKRELDIYESEVKNKKRRADDKESRQ